MQNVRRGSAALRRVVAGCALGVGLFAVVASGHDEDWRKLADSQPAYFGPMITQANMDQLGPAGGFPSEGLEMLAWIPLNEMPGSPQAGNDCWGYVSPSGREYAIFGAYNGYVFVEITDPGNPVIVDNVVGPGSTWHDVKIIGDHAYGVSEAGAGIQVMDLSEIDSGNVIHVGNVQDQGHSSTHNIVANPDSGYLYLVGGNVGNGGLVAVSTADPDAPTIVGGWTEMYVHDAQVVSFTEGPHAGKEIAFCAAGYNGGWNNSGLRIVDVTDKDNMVKVGEIEYPGATYGHQCWINDDGTLLYLNDELDEDNGVVPVTTTRVFDVSDLTNPTLVSTFTSGSTSIDHNLYVHDGMIFEANYRSGLRVFDASDPVNPVQVAYFDTYPENDNPSFNGAWSTYPYFPSGTIIVSDIEKGLFILDLVLDRLAFELPQELPTTLDPGVDTPVSVEVLEDGATLDPSTVTLHVSVDGGAYADVSMAGPDGPGVFTADLPASECFEHVSFYFSAASVAGDVFTMPSDAPVGAYGADVITGVEIALEDDAENDNGWVIGDADDTATTGIWTRANPIGTDAQPEDDHTPSGTDCYFTGQGPQGGGVGDADVDNGKTTLFSPTLDLTTLDSPTISYWRWYSNDAGNAPNTNVFVVDISNDGGETWSNVETVGPSGAETGGGWFQHVFDVADIVEPTSTVMLRFIAEDDPTDGQGSIVEAAIDDLLVQELLCENGCAADFNGDGSLDILDFVAFQGAFQAGEDAADFNGDGSLDILDFVAFQGAFQAGC